jgi:hypothetical protein
VEPERGVALILALLVLSFLSIAGGAFLATATIDIRISDNYKSETQSLYLAEAGIDHAREMLRTSPYTSSQLLTTLAGTDLMLSTSTDPAVLLAGDDRPLLSSQRLIDSSGRVAGDYDVWLRNDIGDGVSTLADSNEVLTLLSLGRIGNSRKIIEVTIQKGKFPEADTDLRLKTVRGLEELVTAVARNATETYAASSIGDYGSPSDYRIAVVNGDVDLGPGVGYGILLVRGEVHVVDSFTWNGLLLIIGQGVMHGKSGTHDTVNGGLFVARTRAADGSLLAAPAGVTFAITDSAQIRAANRSFPYNPIAVIER